ncbi:MAG: hypothetical protein JSS42_11435 [Proteobacteria bacterium]|nr:hypothetical protein [Pseudomonadota bacterium]
MRSTRKHSEHYINRLVHIGDNQMPVPTDLQIFKAIYQRYAQTFNVLSSEEGNSLGKVYMSIDIEALANQLQINKHELFGRLYYHLDHKYRYVQDDKSYVHFFARVVGDKRHCINFPYLAALLAEAKQTDRRNWWALAISLASLIVSASTFVSKWFGH